jgi:acyl-CoA reductase-like NAD-dependent aldehyde dehydrogenase
VPDSPTALVGGRLRRTGASRADVADAVVAARAALPGWSGTSAHDRGRVLYGLAELLDAQRDRFGSSAESVDAAVDRWVWFAGWTDKIAGLLGSVNPVAGPYASWSAPRPIGVVGALAPASLLGLVEVLAPVLAAGSTAVVVAERTQPASALAELLALAELPAGVANLVAGDVAELAPELGRAGVDGLDLGDASTGTTAELERAAAQALTRVLPPSAADDAGLARLRAWSELTTVWHPIGR